MLIGMAATPEKMGEILFLSFGSLYTILAEEARQENLGN
jgi:hypothetical protein